MRALRRGAAVLALAVLVALALFACGGKDSKLPVGVSATDAATRKPNVTPQAIVGHLLGTIGDHAIGPFMARTERGGMVAWITPPEATSRRVVVNPVSAVGEPRGGARAIATVGVDATMLVVRPTRGASAGFALAWTVLTDKGEALWTVVLNDDGVPRAEPVELTRTTDDITWVEIIPTDAGAVTVWTEETRGNDANVFAAGLDVDGKVRGVPARVAKGVTGWHALEVPGGVGVSTVGASANGGANGKGGPLTYQKVDAEGRAASTPVPVVTASVVSGDIEVARAPARLVFAWTDRTGLDPSVGAASLGDDGALEPARKIVEGRGGATLLGLAAGKAGTALVYEAPALKGAGDARHVYTAHLGAGPALDSKSQPFEVMGRGAPEIVATDNGFALLAPQRDCDTGSPRCLDAPVIPSLVRTDGALLPVQREPFGFGADPAQLAWGVSCDHDLCVALAASGAAPSRVRAAEVRARSNVSSQATAAPPVEGPHIEEISAIMTGETVVDLALAHVGPDTLLVTLSSKPDPPGAKVRVGLDDAKTAPLSINARPIDAQGTVGAPVLVTNRALAVGGVAIAPAEKPEDGAAVAWVARDNGDPEVHVTKIDRKGKKTNEVQLTTIKGDASDVAITWANGSWIVAWVDGRDGNGEVYATRLGLDLSRNAGERITNAPGDASDLVALRVGDQVWLAWADPRESPKDGMADIYVAAVGTKDAKIVVKESRLLATAAHSRTPQLAAVPGGLEVAWIEEAPLGAPSSSGSAYGALAAKLATDGRVLERPVKLATGGEGAVTSVALEPHPGGIHAVVARATAEAIALDGLELTAPRPHAYPLVTLDGPPSLDVALVLDSTGLFFNDDGPAVADKRARRARVVW